MKTGALLKDSYERYLKPYVEDDWCMAVVVFFFALVTRLTFLPHLTHDPAFLKPVVDCMEHHMLAQQLLADNWRLTQFGYHTPGYAYFVAAVFKLLGESLTRLAVVQYVLGAACASAIFLIIKHLINRGAALFGAFLMSVYWFLIYTQSHVYSENLSMLFNLLMVAALLFLKDSWYKYLIAGVLLGASAVVRPEIMPFAAAVLVWLLVRKVPLTKLLMYYLIFASGTALCVLPLLIRNHQLSGEYLFRQQIGVNVYMGSLPEFKGSNIYVSVGREWDKVIRLPFRELNLTDEDLNEKERTAFYVGKVIDFAKAHPFQWSAFMAGKIFSVLVGIDFMRSEDVYFYDNHVRGRAVALIQTWFICILALAGAYLTARREPRKYLLLYLYFGAYLAAMVFTYKTRYLISHMPLFIIFAAYAFNVLIEAVRRRDLRQLKWLLGAMFVLYVAVRFNPLDIVWPTSSETYYVLAVHRSRPETFAEAEELFNKAIEVDPENVDALRHLGILYMNAGYYDKALVPLEAALDLAPEDQWIASLYDEALFLYRRGGF